jgi:hypothetical protein
MESEPGTAKPKPFPSELIGRTPHRIRLTGTGWVCASVSTCLVLLGAYFGIKLVQLVNKEKAGQISLRQSGVQTIGQITSKRRGLLNYTFEVDGTNYSGRAEAPVDVEDSVREGDPLPVRYLRAAPDVNHPAAWEGSPSSDWWGLIIPVFFAFMGLGFAWRFPLEYRVAVNGVPAWACIAERDQISTGKSLWHWENYTFRNADDEEQFGRCPMVATLRAGATVCVLYLPEKPDTSHIYPLDFFEIEQ